MTKKYYQIYDENTGDILRRNGRIVRVSDESREYYRLTSLGNWVVSPADNMIVPKNLSNDKLYEIGGLIRTFVVFDDKGMRTFKNGAPKYVKSGSKEYKDLKAKGYLESAIALSTPKSRKEREEVLQKKTASVTKEQRKLIWEKFGYKPKPKKVVREQKPVAIRVGEPKPFRTFRSQVYRVDGANTTESYYDAMKDEMEKIKHKDAYLYTRYINPDGQYRYISTKPINTATFDRFNNYLEKIGTGDQGSDPIADGSIPDYSWAALAWFTLGGNGINSIPFFVKVAPEEEKIIEMVKDGGLVDKGCLYRAVKYFIPNLSPDLEAIDDAAEMYRILISEYSAVLTVYTDYLNTKRIGDKYQIMKLKDGKEVKEFYLAELEKSKTGDDDLPEINFLGESRRLAGLEGKYFNAYVNQAPKMVADEITPNPDIPLSFIKIVRYDNHYIPYIGLRPGKFYVDAAKNYYYVENGRIVDRISKREKIRKRDQDCPYLSDRFQTEVVAFDLETVFDENHEGLLKPYSVSFETQDYDHQVCDCSRGCEDAHGVIKKTHFYMGDDCVERMFKYLLDHEQNRKFCLLGYNSSRFDNIFLIPELLKLDKFDDVFYQKNSILNIKWGGRHTVHDICRFTVSSLKAACINFQTTYKKVDGFRHELIQEHYNKHGEVASYYHEAKCPFSDPKNKSDMISVPVHVVKQTDEEKIALKHKYYISDDGDVVKDRYTCVTTIHKHINNGAIFKKKGEFLTEDRPLYKEIGTTFAEKIKERVKYVEKLKKTNDEFKNSIRDGRQCGCKKYGDLVKYNMYDVCSTLELYEKIETVMRDNGAIQGRLFDHKTIGAIIYKSFVDTTKDISLPKVELDVYKRIRSALVAGRTQCYNGVDHDMAMEKKPDGTPMRRYVMLDVKSLYPYVMLNRMFPCGDLINGSFDECMKKNLIGFYNCRFNQSKLNKNVLPKRSENSSLDWTYKDDLVMFINTIDIKCLLDAGADVEILKKQAVTKQGKPRFNRKKEPIMEDDGFYFSDKVRGDNLFKCLLKWKIIKEQQDLIKKYNDDKKKPFLSVAEREETQKAIDEIKATVDVSATNVVLRNMAKTFLNSLSGKVIEQIHLETTTLVRNESDIDRVLKNSVSTGDIQLTAAFNSRTGLVTYKRDEIKEYKRQYRPLYLGVLIYAYARDHMYRSVLADYDVIYQDTDSALMNRDEYNRFMREQPELLGDNFGQFALEDYSDLFDSYVTLSPKNYFIFGEKDGERKLLKKGFKGVNLGVDKYIANPEDYAGYITYHDSARFGRTYSISPKKAFKLYNGLYKKENHSFPTPKTVAESLGGFVGNILEKGEAYVLTSSLTKTLKTAIGGGMQAGCVYQRYMLKRVTVDKNIDAITKKSPKIVGRPSALLPANLEKLKKNMHGLI